MLVLQLRRLLALTLLLGLLGLAGALTACGAEPGRDPRAGRAAPGASGRPTPSGPSAPTRPERQHRRAGPTLSPTPAQQPTAPTSPYVTRVPEPDGCLRAQSSIVGVKVYLVQQALGLVGHKERYDAATVAAVRRFQAAHGLEVDGIVGPLTWAALGIDEPFCVDRYTAQPTVAADAGAQERIEAMIRYATQRVGLPYVWGGAGPMGFDCSGLVLQAMYAGGRSVPGLDTDLHVGADFRTTHYLYESDLLHVPYAQRRRGDLVFYGNPITHMAIYLGGGRIVEAVRPVARTAGVLDDGMSVQPMVVRPFPG